MPAKIDPDQVSRIARLARINLTPGEIQQFAGQLSDILNYVDDLEGAAPVHDDVTGTGDQTPRYDRYALHQNYPNPFNPDTEIRYEVPEYAGRTQVIITIYDVRGRLVKKLEDRERSAGEYRVRWNGLNESGESVSSGVYFYVLRTGQVTLSRKLVLLR